jgi:CRISPR-associated protein Cas2
LEGYGSRVQYSVFRCWLSAVEMQRLRWELTEKFVVPEDDVIFIPLCARCVAGLAVAHSTSKRPDWPEAPRSHEVL